MNCLINQALFLLFQKTGIIILCVLSKQKAVALVCLILYARSLLLIVVPFVVATTSTVWKLQKWSQLCYLKIESTDYTGINAASGFRLKDHRRIWVEADSLSQLMKEHVNC